MTTLVLVDAASAGITATRLSLERTGMVRLSTVLILLGIVFVIAPIPPVGMILAALCFAIGLPLRFVFDK
ncbi:hypothetical protein [Natronosalvus halobius]|uniref:hypothetical protein n=1 Tax=Natronosalvus halobius TaxID=2953746 RepID=UPI0020A0B93E|nr:hypothetical protein [Natronosalvus halobius]USZ73188.1 hypothetical protein NGM15_07785 [Natronosalvus halobius]